ncbi:MAG: hypothetical protein MJY61_05650 [Bacteroidales bacterium]|nr:hypothetical protein [Bacteroidales bacterium]
MASSKEYADFVRDKFERISDVVTVRPMMGAYVLHMAGKVLGFIGEDRLLLEPGPTIAKLLPDAQTVELFPGSKKFYVIEDSISSARLCEIAAAIYDDLPVSKPRGGKKGRKAPAVRNDAGKAEILERFPFAKNIKW